MKTRALCQNSVSKTNCVDCLRGPEYDVRRQWKKGRCTCERRKRINEAPIRGFTLAATRGRRQRLLLDPSRHLLQPHHMLFRCPAPRAQPAIHACPLRLPSLIPLFCPNTPPAFNHIFPSSSAKTPKKPKISLANLTFLSRYFSQITPKSHRSRDSPRRSYNLRHHSDFFPENLRTEILGSGSGESGGEEL